MGGFIGGKGFLVEACLAGLGEPILLSPASCRDECS